MKAQLNSSIRTYLTTALSIVILYLCTAATHLANVDLKGEWTYNETKSKIAAAQGNFRIAPLKLKITPEANGIAIERTSAGRNGADNMVSTDHITFDGKESESTAFGTNKKKSTATWSADGKQLTINATITFDQGGSQGDFKSTEVFSLSEDGKTLTINFSSAQYAQLNGTFAYDKTN